MTRPRTLAFALGASIKLQNPYPPLVASSLSVAYGRAKSISACLDHKSGTQKISAHLNSDRACAVLIKACQSPAVAPFLAVYACHSSYAQATIPARACVGIAVLGFEFLHKTGRFDTTAVVKRHTCTPFFALASVRRKHCQKSAILPTQSLGVCIDVLAYKTQVKHACQLMSTLPAYPVPCRYYPLPVAPKGFSCPPPPPSDRLPLPINTTKTNQPSHALNLAFACKANPPSSTPSQTGIPTYIHSQRAYLMNHRIQASIQGKKVNPIAFGIQTDMNSFCWQGQIELSLDDYTAIKGFERPIIKVAINQTAFVLIGEDITINQSFGKHSISLSGRSLSAMLAQEYAQTRPIQDTDLYASQIVSAQLENNPIQANFGMTDYRVPRGAYTATGKTPIAVLDDIATACGGFLYSDPALPIIHLLPRYKHPAWQIKSADVVISKDTIKTLSTTHQKRPRYNTITLVGQTQGGIVYRLDMGQDKDAPVASHPLYTEQACIVSAGTALLSDSGDKSKISLTTLLSDTVPLAKLGDVWQIGAEGIKAVVVSVAVSASVSSGVVSVWQTVGLIADKEQA